MNGKPRLLEARNLAVRRDNGLGIDVPRLDVVQGETLALIGPNGAGKTTLLLALSFLVKQFTGDIVFEGAAMRTRGDILRYRRRLAMVFQEPLLFDTTVYENAASGLKIRGYKHSAIRQAVTEQLGRFGIEHLASRSSRTLSGGEAQRTSLARAFATKPELLLLDEPFSSLDQPTRESLTDDLSRELARTGTTAILATHDRLEALRLADRIAVMNRGRIVQTGPPEEVMNRPIDEFVASFVGVETVLAGEVVETGEGTFASLVSGRKIEAVGNAAAGESVLLCIRPENVTLSADGQAAPTSARNVFTGTIELIVTLGHFRKVTLDCGFRIVAYVTHHSFDALALREGKKVIVTFKATAVHTVRNKA